MRIGRGVAGRQGCRAGIMAFGLAVFGAAGAHAAPTALPTVPQVSPLQHIMPHAAPNLGQSLPDFRPVGREGAVPDQSVPVHSVAVLGATAFSPAQLRATVGKLIGAATPLPAIEAARLRLLALYRGHGYVLTAVSAEINRSGDLRFIVTEGHIVSVKLSRNIGPVGTLVLGFLDHLTHERPVRQASLEHWLLLAQQIPGVAVGAVLQPNAAAPGALTLVADVVRRPFSALVTADNRGFDETGPAEGLVVGDMNSFTSLGEQSQASFFHTSGGTNNFGQFSESFFAGTSGLRIGIYFGAGRAIPSGTLREVGYRAHLDVFGLYASYPLWLERGQSLELKARFDGTDNIVYTASGFSGAGTPASTDSVRALRIELDEAVSDDVLGAARPALTTATLEASRGLRLFGASANGRSNAGRLGERFDFWKIDLSLDRTQTLFNPWRNASVALEGTFGGQYSPDILPSSETFYLGGNHIAQGYYSGQVTGDDALYASAELQLNTPLNLRLLGRHFFIGSQFYTFYDWGQVWQNEPRTLGQKPNDKRLASFGGGVRLRLTRRIEFDIAAVHRLVTQLQPPASGVPPLRETAVYWGVLARY